MQLLKAGNSRDFIAEWNLLVFQFPTPRSRSGISMLGKELSSRLFPSEKQKEKILDTQIEEAKFEFLDPKKRVLSDYMLFESVKKEIAAIAKAVSQGHDEKAKLFLKQLIEKQTSSSGSKVYAVKSLCNIAQRCADMFRMDFEIDCLEKACELNPDDAWALIQYGDHLKRVGKYDDALQVFTKADQLGSDVAKSSIADVYSQQGAYEKAIYEYKNIPNFQDKLEIVTAIADNLRKMGRMDEAEATYKEIICLAQQGLKKFIANEVRAQAGIAEIAKRQGKLDDALQIYNGILQRQDIDDRDRFMYKLGLCNILKIMEKFDMAYAVVDEIIQEYPFAMQARFIRGSILGLIGREIEGLKDLPESNVSRSWQEWLRCYYRGLLLFKLKRYKDAKKNLVEELSKAIASGEDKGILRMAAALWYLQDGAIPEADSILADIPVLYDCHAQYLSLVLKLHSATQREDLALMKSLREQIANIDIVNEKLEKAVVALGEKDYSRVITYETEALLKIAA